MKEAIFNRQNSKQTLMSCLLANISTPACFKSYSMRNKIKIIKQTHLAGLSISFEVASSFWKVGVSLISERLRREPPRGVWGHAPPENFEI